MFILLIEPWPAQYISLLAHFEVWIYSSRDLQYEHDHWQLFTEFMMPQLLDNAGIAETENTD